MNTRFSPSILRKLPWFLAGLVLPALPLTLIGEEDGAKPDKTLDVKLSLDRDKLVRGEEQDVVLKIDLVGAKVKVHNKRLPLNVAVVLDRSGSMSGAKLEQARQAASMLVDRLDEDDVFALVTYESEVEVNISATKVGDNADKWQRQIRRIESGGSTALYAGVDAGGDEVREYLKSNRINRVLLLSDGLANVGKKSPREITDLGKKLAKDGIGVSTIGLGEDYDEDLMTALAEASDANYYYVQDVEKLPDVFQKELGQFTNIVARDVEIRITLPEGVTPVEIMGRSESFSGREATIRLSQFNAAQKREILVKTRLAPGKDAAEIELAQISAKYVDELDGGKEGKLSAQAKAGTTDDQKASDKSRNEEVLTRVQQMDTDKAKRDAADLAAAGQKDRAREVLQKQIAINSGFALSAPAAAAPMADENSKLQLYSEEFEKQSGDDLKSTAKRAKAESWSRSNAKQ
jgi:Ca-activated chloride channel family protein